MSSATELSALSLAETTSDEAVDDPIPTEREDGDGAVADNSPTNGSSADAGPSDSAVESDAVSEKKLAREAATTAPPVENKTPDGKKESGGHVASHSSKQLAGSSKLEDQINLQHLVELMKIFYVRLYCY